MASTERSSYFDNLKETQLVFLRMIIGLYLCSLMLNVGANLHQQQEVLPAAEFSEVYTQYTFWAKILDKVEQHPDQVLDVQTELEELLNQIHPDLTWLTELRFYKHIYAANQEAYIVSTDPETDRVFGQGELKMMMDKSFDAIIINAKSSIFQLPMDDGALDLYSGVFSIPKDKITKAEVRIGVEMSHDFVHHQVPVRPEFFIYYEFSLDDKPSDYIYRWKTMIRNTDDFQDSTNLYAGEINMGLFLNSWIRFESDSSRGKLMDFIDQQLEIDKKNLLARSES